ncbi:unnamed protein product [Symbiodinium natans]|uniref:Uncharacterized protein n=1 Tax=Symbiodinium natans TaxID=878477 RepID=A0A812TGW6_9DINO|nr:unnamed protein product [Symbiodinium natans]
MFAARRVLAGPSPGVCRIYLPTYPEHQERRILRFPGVGRPRGWKRLISPQVCSEYCKNAVLADMLIATCEAGEVALTRRCPDQVKKATILSNIDGPSPELMGQTKEEATRCQRAKKRVFSARDDAFFNFEDLEELELEACDEYCLR